MAMDQSKSPPPNPISSSSSTLGYSFFFGAYFFGYYFFFYCAAGFPAPVLGADPPLPIFESPEAISFLTSLPFKVSISLFKSASAMLALADPRTAFKSAAAKLREN